MPTRSPAVSGPLTTAGVVVNVPGTYEAFLQVVEPFVLPWKYQLVEFETPR
jgi:hypothetical protein